MRNCGVLRPHPLRSLGFDPNTIRRYGGELRDTLADGIRMRTDLRRGENQRGIDIHNFVAGYRNPAESIGKKNRRVCSLPACVRRGKKSSDVRGSDCSEQRVGYGVEQNITIGVPTQSPFVRNFHSSNFEWNATFEFMR